MLWGHDPPLIKVSWFSKGEAVELFLMDAMARKVRQGQIPSFFCNGKWTIP